MNIKKLQLKICKKYQSEFEQLQSDEMVAVALDTLGQMPICGERIVLEAGQNVSWFIHCGEHSDAEDFYKPVHWYHLIDLLPEVLPYLGLSQGFRFIIDNEGYEDVWSEI
ncbi:hypothetical protein [Capnocytophaga sp.]|uniref:immunity protein Imm33 domain-containing protein n=1 Tax=Capnocytophaga sp. TaxID=44737 RepID=UPI0026DB00B0|nr:hypothetical protein [Capnocytophaga sp.]MDO5105629.1 hypothetical protein [Capnocytophaga sp.]